MSIDAVALFRPKNPAALRPYLDLDEDSEESNGLYAEALDDGSVLVHTFQSYAAFEASPIEGRAWLSQFGADLPLVHDDPRGFLFFPDVAEPSGRTYDAVVAEIASAGVWIPAAALTAEEAQARDAALLAGVEAIQHGDALPPLDMSGLPAMAQQLFASMNLGSPDGPTDINSLMAALQKQLMGAMGGAGGAGGAAGDLEFPGDDDDVDAFDSVVVLLQRTTPLVLGDDDVDDVNDVGALADGTAIIHTTAPSAATEMVALGLAEEHALWAAEHHDPRGVPSFGARHLDAILDAATYHDALATLGDAVVFLQPRSLDQLEAEKKANLRKLVGKS